MSAGDVARDGYMPDDMSWGTYPWLAKCGCCGWSAAALGARGMPGCIAANAGTLAAWGIDAWRPGRLAYDVLWGIEWYGAWNGGDPTRTGPAVCAWPIGAWLIGIWPIGGPWTGALAGACAGGAILIGGARSTCRRPCVQEGPVCGGGMGTCPAGSCTWAAGNAGTGPWGPGSRAGTSGGAGSSIGAGSGAGGAATGASCAPTDRS